MKKQKKVVELKKHTPLFQEYCRIWHLTEGDTYDPESFASWADSLTTAMHKHIMKKYSQPLPEPKEDDNLDDRKNTGLLLED